MKTRLFTTTSFYQKVALAGLILIVLASFFSIGYHHPDEHFQIIEFCNYKMGNVPAADLSWEFRDQIRPGLPVLICYTIFGFFKLIGITNPFMLAFLLRLVIGLFAWIILKKLATLLIRDFKHEQAKKIFFASVFLLWFMPYLHVRFSSENLAALTFLAAVYLILKTLADDTPRKVIPYMLAGLFLGFSFYFRFQIGFAILGLGLGLLVVKKIRIADLLKLLAGGIFSLFLCVISDYWLYDDWVISPWNYFNANILQDVASGWGVSPWWYYFYMFFLQVIPPISLALLFFFGWGIAHKPNHIFVWIMVPFLLAHFLVGHKEMRFLFPMIIPFLYMAVIGINQFLERGRFIRAGRILVIVLVVINIPFLAFRTLAPARELLYYHWFLYELADDKKIELVCLGEDVYNPSQLPIHFYTSPNVVNHVIADEISMQQYLDTTKPETIYVLDQNIHVETVYAGYSQEQCFSILPEEWIAKINVNDWTSHAKIWQIIRFDKKH